MAYLPPANEVCEAVADLGGAPPTAQHFLNFMQFFAKFGKIIYWCPPGGLVSPPTGNPGSAPVKVMFSLVSVCLAGGGLHLGGVSVLEGLFPEGSLSRGSLSGGFC